MAGSSPPGHQSGRFRVAGQAHDTAVLLVQENLSGVSGKGQLQITVNNTVLVEVLERQADLGGVELRTLSTELTSLNVQHQITTTNVLHDEVHTGLCLEACMQVGQEWVSAPVGNQEHTLLRTDTLDFIILDDELLLENLDGIELSRALGFGQHNFTEVTLAQHSQEVEMIKSDTLASSRETWVLVAEDYAPALRAVGRQPVAAVVGVAVLEVAVTEEEVVGLAAAVQVAEPEQQAVVLRSQGSRSHNRPGCTYAAGPRRIDLLEHRGLLAVDRNRRYIAQSLSSAVGPHQVLQT
ncbi:hypothetical protein HG531_010330 [Fusarium graminearum]|nr:hypothetical protein HG531_010330 [Fusarium graminearum]